MKNIKLNWQTCKGGSHCILWADKVVDKHVDNACSYWKKGQCDRPYSDLDACKKCKEECKNKLKNIIGKDYKAVEIIIKEQ